MHFRISECQGQKKTNPPTIANVVTDDLEDTIEWRGEVTAVWFSLTLKFLIIFFL